MLFAISARRDSILAPERSRELAAVLVADHAGDLHHGELLLRQLLRRHFHLSRADVFVHGLAVIVAEAVLELCLRHMHLVRHLPDRNVFVYPFQNIAAGVLGKLNLGLGAILCPVRAHLLTLRQKLQIVSTN